MRGEKRDADGVCSIDATRFTCDDRDDDDRVCRDPDAERRQLDAAARARAEDHVVSGAADFAEHVYRSTRS